MEPWVQLVFHPCHALVFRMRKRGAPGSYTQAQACTAGEEQNQEAWRTAFWEAARAEEGTQAVKSGKLPPTPHRTERPGPTTGRLQASFLPS